jgi:hypothetical protein
MSGGEFPLFKMRPVRLCLDPLFRPLMIIPLWVRAFRSRFSIAGGYRSAAEVVAEVALEHAVGRFTLGPAIQPTFLTAPQFALHAAAVLARQGLTRFPADAGLDERSHLQLLARQLMIGMAVVPCKPI